MADRRQRRARQRAHHRSAYARREPADGDREGRRLGPVPLPPPRAPRPGRRRDLGLGRPTWSPSTPPTPGTRSTCWSRRCTTTTGVLRGTLAIDLPDNGRRPGAAAAPAPREVRRAGRPRRGHDPRAGGAGRAGPAGRGRPHDRPQRQRPAELERILADCQAGARRGLPGPTASWIQTFDEDGRRHRRDLLVRPAARSSSPPSWSARRARGPPGLGRSRRSRSSSRGQPLGADRHCTPGRARSSSLPRQHRHRLDAVRPARRRAGVPGQPGADPRARPARVDRARAGERPLDIGHDLGRVDPQRPHVRARAPSWSWSCRPSTPTRAS